MGIPNPADQPSCVSQTLTGPRRLRTVPEGQNPLLLFHHLNSFCLIGKRFTARHELLTIGLRHLYDFHVDNTILAKSNRV